PMLEATAQQTNGTFVLVYTLHLAAAPLRDLWFSTASGFHSALWEPPTNSVSDGALLSFSGRVVRRNIELAGRLGIMPSVPDRGLDDVGLVPGGGGAFCIPENIFIETVGPLHNGNILAESGRIVRRSQDLLAACTLHPPAPD